MTVPEHAKTPTPQANRPGRPPRRYWQVVGVIAACAAVIGAGIGATHVVNSYHVPVHAAGSPGSAQAAPPRTTLATPTELPPAAHPRLVLDLRGNGIKSSAEFTVDGPWQIVYEKPQCAQGLLQVWVMDSRNGMVGANPVVNDGGAGSGDTTVYATGRNLHLDVGGTCLAWHVVVIAP